jgi:2-C-methyl-D-erythritol 4-phosphate cytidylyltransferase
MNIAIIFAGGTGQRCRNEENTPKQFVEINDKPIIVHTLEVFQNHKEIDKIYIAILPAYKNALQDLIKKFALTKVRGLTNGGETGQDSIYNALKLARGQNNGDAIVLIHDGVRPIISKEVISKNIESVKKYGNAITCTPATETVLISEDSLTTKMIPFRKQTFNAQAPQSFRLDDIIKCHDFLRSNKERYENIVDSATMCNHLNIKTFMVKGNFGNIKITTQEDMFMLRALLGHIKKER